MNNISEQLLNAIDIVTDNKISQLQFDKTIQATIYKIVNLDSGEYKVRYAGNIFSAFAENDAEYKVDDMVYVTVPEGNFSQKKIISGLVSSKSLNYNSLAALRNSIFDISPNLNALYGEQLYKDYEIVNGEKVYTEFGVVAGAPIGTPISQKYIYNGPQQFASNQYHGLFQQYANNYELIRIQADFVTRFYNVHTKGNYGIEIEFYAKGMEGTDVVSYRLDLNTFNGDPYHLSVFSPQSVIIKVQKNYLLGLKSIRLFEEDFVYDKILENGVAVDKENRDTPNIFVKNISIQYVDQKDLTDTNYYLMISAPQGIAFTQNVSKLELSGRLVYQGKDIMDDKACKCRWFTRNLNVMIGDQRYDKEAGFGWEPLELETPSITLVPSDVLYEKKYKLLVTYNNTVSLASEIEIFNHKADYNYHLEQVTNDADISLKIINQANSKPLAGDWFASYPDGKYIEMTNGKKKPSISVSDYLKYSSVTFYCQIYDYNNTNVIGTLEHTIFNSESDEDVTISYTGEDNFRYDANGDITIEDSEKERTLQVNLSWKEGYGTAYTVQWLIRDSAGKEINLDGNIYKPQQSMINELWVDSNNILHYNIKQKYQINLQNNTLIVRIKTITEQEYNFDKEIIFLKDGDQGTNGTTYIVAIRPCNSNGVKLSGFRPLVYNNGWRGNLLLKCYVYKDGQQIRNDDKYGIEYYWTGVNIRFSEIAADANDPPNQPEIVTAMGMGTINSWSNSNALQFYVKIRVNINDKMNNRSTNIYASYPIDVAVGGINTSQVDISNIPSYIKYTASGVIPQFYSNNIVFKYNGSNLTSNIVPMNKKILTTEVKDGMTYLKPATSFIMENINDEDQSNIGVLKCWYSSSQYILHSIIMYLDMYGNEAINGWDGEGVKIVDDQGTESYVLAPQVGAGYKDSYNRFCGVVMGKDTSQKLTGVYGYQSGEGTFGLKEDGTAFFGSKKRGGQIIIDGRTAQLYGGGQALPEGRPELVGGAAPNGMTITLANLNPNNPGKQYAIRIAQDKFYVMYDGAMKATSADVTGKIFAQEGQIGCDEKHRGGWTITSDQISSGSGQNTVALNSAQDSYFRIWAGATSAGSSYDPDAPLESKITRPARFVVTKDGFVYMRDCFIKGRIEAEEGKVGGWNILRNKLVSDNGKIGLASSGTYRFWSNSDNNAMQNDPTFNSNGTYFYVKGDGTMSCRNATVRGTIEAEKGFIGNWHIKDNNLQTEDGKVFLSATKGIKVTDNFSVDINGKLYAKNANIEGNITAAQITIDSKVLLPGGQQTTGIHGIIGIVEGSSGDEKTYNLGMKSSSNSVIVESVSNVARISGGNGVYVSSQTGQVLVSNNYGQLLLNSQSGVRLGTNNKGKNNEITINSQDITINGTSVKIKDKFEITNQHLKYDKFEVTSQGLSYGTAFTVSESTFELNRIPAENQKGIYARFG